MNSLTGTGDISETVVLPTSMELAQNYPNPFNPSTQIKYSIPSRSQVTLRVYNMMGQVVFTHHIVLNGGTSEKTFDLSRLGAGVYYFRFKGHNTKLVLH